MVVFQFVEGKEEEGCKVFVEFVVVVEVNEFGVFVYICYQVSDDFNKVFFFEIYKDQEVLINYGGQLYMVKLMMNVGIFFLLLFDIVKLDCIVGFFC